MEDLVGSADSMVDYDPLNLMSTPPHYPEDCTLDSFGLSSMTLNFSNMDDAVTSFSQTSMFTPFTTPYPTPGPTPSPSDSDSDNDFRCDPFLSEVSMPTSFWDSEPGWGPSSPALKPAPRKSMFDTAEDDYPFLSASYSTNSEYLETSTLATLLKQEAPLTVSRPEPSKLGVSQETLQRALEQHQSVQKPALPTIDPCKSPALAAREQRSRSRLGKTKRSQIMQARQAKIKRSLSDSRGNVLHKTLSGKFSRLQSMLDGSLHKREVPPPPAVPRPKVHDPCTLDHGSYTRPSTSPGPKLLLVPKTHVPSVQPTTIYKTPPVQPTTVYKMPPVQPTTVYKMPPVQPSPLYRVEDEDEDDDQGFGKCSKGAERNRAQKDEHATKERDRRSKTKLLVENLQTTVLGFAADAFEASGTSAKKKLSKKNTLDAAFYAVTKVSVRLLAEMQRAADNQRKLRILMRGHPYIRLGHTKDSQLSTAEESLRVIEKRYKYLQRTDFA